MNRTGNAKWDALPPKLGRADVENLRFLYVKHGLNWDGAAQSSVAKTLDKLAEKLAEADNIIVGEWSSSLNLYWTKTVR